MKNMANSDHLKALLENPEFLKKFQSLVNEHSASGVIKNGDSDSISNKRQSVGIGTKRVYKRRKVVNQSAQKQNDSIEDFKSLLQEDDIKEKIVQNISECIQVTNNCHNSSDKKVAQTTHKNNITIDAIEDVRRLSIDEIIFPNHSAAEVKPLGKPLGNVRIKRKSLHQNELELHFADRKHSEHVLLDKKTNFYVKDKIKVLNGKTQDASMNKETINESLKKSKIIRLVPIQIIKSKHISPEKSNPPNKSIALKQPADLNTQDNGENLEMSQSDDFYYLNLANGLNTSESENSDILRVNNITSNILDNSNINSSITIEQDTPTPEVEPIVLKPVIKSNENEKALFSNRIVRRFNIPTCKIQDQISETDPKSVGLVNTQNTSTIIVLTDNGEKSVKIQSAQKKAGPKPVIKSNERVLQGKIIVKGKTIRKIGNDINDSVVSDISDDNITNADPADSFKLPKIESVMSYAESLPRITNVTSCASISNVESLMSYAESLPRITNVTSCASISNVESVMSYAESLPRITNVTSCASISNVESVVTHIPEFQRKEDISLAERISTVSRKPEKILKIIRPVTKLKGKKKLQHKVVEQIKDINGEDKKKSDNLSSNASVDATIEEVIAQGVDEILDTSLVAVDEKKSQESPNLHINGTSIRSSPRKGLKVLKPVKRIECANSDIQSDNDNVSFVTEESVDRSGLPSIKNVVSLVHDRVLDDCLEEANQKLSSSNGFYTANTPEKKLEVLKPDAKDDDEFQLPSELFEDLDIDLQSGNDDFNYAIDSLIEDIKKQKTTTKSQIKSKVSPLSLKKQFGPSNVRNKKFKVTKPVKRRKRGKRKAMFTRRKARVAENSIKNDTNNIENSIPNNIDNVENSIQNGTDDVDLIGMKFADRTLIDTESTFVDSEYNDASIDKSMPIKMDILDNKLSPMQPLEKQYKSDTSCLVQEKTASADNYIAELSDNSKTIVEEPPDDSLRAVEEPEELLEEVPLQQRRCNNFYVKIPTGEELGSNINLEEYEKFFSIQDENHRTKNIQKVEIESLDNDEDLPGTPGKRRTKCSKCDRTFVNSTNRKIHEATCENTDPQSSECSKCGRWFARTASRKVHEKKCQKVFGTIEVPITPLNDILRCAMCPFNTRHKTAYINHLKSHMYSHKITTTLSSRAAALRRKFGYRRKKKRLRFEALKNRCEICSDDAAGVEHMVSRCRRCGAFNLQWCDVCHKGGYSTACRLRHHEAECTATPHTRCNDVPRVRVEKIGPPLPLHCVNCDVTRILYIREKRCKQCSSQLLFKCEMCAELRDTYAELCGHVARAHIYELCLVQCNECGKNCEDLTLHQRVCESQRKENDSAVNTETIHFSEDEDSSEETQRIMDNLILELDEESDDLSLENDGIMLEEESNEEQVQGLRLEEESDEEQVQGLRLEEESGEEQVQGLRLEEESGEEQVQGLRLEEDSDEEQVQGLRLEEESDEEQVQDLRLEEESDEEQVQGLRLEEESDEEQVQGLRLEEESDEEQVQGLRIEEV